jgi:methylated-DNA-[protein]-cysteine S-methyltransferase
MPPGWPPPSSPPEQWVSGVRGRMEGVPRHRVIPSPIGPLTLVVDGGAVTQLLMGETGNREIGERDEALLPQAAAQLGEYFAGERHTFDLPLAPAGDDFKQRVWALLREIPYGETRSYGDLARALGDVGLSQAVGTANARNPIAIVVPCHRVIGSDGSLTGYAGGLERKRFLLALEDTEEQRAARLF